MKISPRKRFYHGSPVKIIQFSVEFTNKGHDALGPGFYFTDSIEDALLYTGEEKQNPMSGLEIAPTVHTVLLDVQKPLVKDLEGMLTAEQIKAILRHLPDQALADGLWDHGDIGAYGIDKVLNAAAKSYSGHVTLSRRLWDLANDFFDDHVDVFNRAVRSVLGYDAVTVRQPTGVTHVCAWFPEQVKIIKHTPAKDVSPDDGLTPG